MIAVAGTIDMKVITLEEYAALDAQSLKWLVPGILPSPGVVLLLGQPKSGKSFLALQLAFCLANRKPFLGHYVPQQQCVLYIQLDTSLLVWRDRLNQLAEHGQPLSGPIYMLHPHDMPKPLLLTDGNIQLQLKQILHKLCPALIIIDTLRESHNADENDSTTMKQALDSVLRPFADHAVLLLHHTNKGQMNVSRDPITATRGSSYVAGRVDSIWLLEHDKLMMEPRFAPPLQIKLFQSPSGLFLPAS